MSISRGEILVNREVRLYSFPVTPNHETEKGIDAMKRIGLILMLALTLGTAVRAQQPANLEANKPALFMSLPDYANTPDGMTLDDKSGDIFLSCPNFADETYPGIIVKINPQNKRSIYYTMPVHPDTKHCFPMGQDIGPDGNIYVADCQYLSFKKVPGKEHLSRVICVQRDAQGEPIGDRVAVDGLNLANALLWMDDALYVSDTCLDLPGKLGMGGIWRFTKDELDKGTVHIYPRQHDPHLIATFQCVPNERDDLAASDGMTRDSQKNIYIGNFGNGVIYKGSAGADGKWTFKELINDPKLSCCDGIFCDLKTDKIYLADSAKNAIQVFTPDGKWSTLWQNGDTDGADGLLDQPCEAIVRGDELIVANFDFIVPGGLLNSSNDKVHTLSVIKLK